MTGSGKLIYNQYSKSKRNNDLLLTCILILMPIHQPGAYILKIQQQSICAILIIGVHSDHGQWHHINLQNTMAVETSYTSTYICVVTQLVLNIRSIAFTYMLF